MLKDRKVDPVKAISSSDTVEILAFASDISKVDDSTCGFEVNTSVIVLDCATPVAIFPVLPVETTAFISATFSLTLWELTTTLGKLWKSVIP